MHYGLIAILVGLIGVSIKTALERNEEKESEAQRLVGLMMEEARRKWTMSPRGSKEEKEALEELDKLVEMYTKLKK